MKNDIPLLRKEPFILFVVVQWSLSALLIIVVSFALNEARKLGAPGAPVAFYSISLLSMVLVAMLLSPPIFFRLPDIGRVIAYAGMVASLVALGLSIEQIQPFWERTPEGKKEAAEFAAREKARAAISARQAKETAERKQWQRKLAELENSQRQLEEIQARLEACFSWGHELPDLTNAVKESLHNPDSFEHVETVLIVPDNDRNNVVMEFRAENGFGAIRTAHVKAQLVADDQGCTVQNIREPEVN